MIIYNIKYSAQVTSEPLAWLAVSGWWDITRRRRCVFGIPTNITIQYIILYVRRFSWYKFVIYYTVIILYYACSRRCLIPRRLASSAKNSFGRRNDNNIKYCITILYIPIIVITTLKGVGRWRWRSSASRASVSPVSVMKSLTMVLPIIRYLLRFSKIV